MANESETIGQRLRARRVERGLTLAEVSELADLSLPYVSNLERGRGNPTLEALEALASALEISVASLLGEVGQADSLEVLLASAPKSLIRFSRTDEFKTTVREMAQRQGESEEDMRSRVLTGMISSPQRSSGESKESDWLRILDTYDRILRIR